MDKSKLQIPFAPCFLPFIDNLDARNLAAFGGRGGMKSHFFAGLMVSQHLKERGRHSICLRESDKANSLSTLKLLKDKVRQYKLESQGFKIYSDVIQTPGDGLIVTGGLQDYSAESIKGLDGFSTAYIDEAHFVTQSSLNLLKPTMRAKGSQLWFAWNPRRKMDAVDLYFRGVEKPSKSIILQVDWRDMPKSWMTDELEQERLDCLRMTPEQYPHIWEGEYVTVATGAYYAETIEIAKQEKRVGHVPIDPLLPIRAVIDIGATGANSDAFSMWIEQTVGNEIHFVDYYEAQGQPLSTHVAWLRANGYENASIILPHDGRKHDVVYKVTVEGSLTEAGFSVITVPNQGKGAAMMRIEAGKRIMPRCFFDKKCIDGGLAALGWYHKKIDETRGIDLGPEHDWSSHAADAFGLFAVAEIEKYIDVKIKRPTRNKKTNWRTA